MILLNRKSFLPFVIGFCLALFSCSTTRLSVNDDFTSPQPTDQNSAFQLISVSKNCTVVKINLNNPSLQIMMNEPDSKSSEKLHKITSETDFTGDTNIQAVSPEKSDWNKSLSVKDFALLNDCFLAVNTNPFFRKTLLSSKVKPIGIVINNGAVRNPPDSRYAALCFYKTQQDYKAVILDSQSELNITGISAVSDASGHTAYDDSQSVNSANSANAVPDFASGGYWTILKDDQIIQFKDYKNYRIGAAVSDDGSQLFLLAGKKLSFMDCGEIFKKLGAAKAMEFDGGNSSALVLNGKNLLKVSGRRRVSSVLGFKLK